MKTTADLELEETEKRLTKNLMEQNVKSQIDLQQALINEAYHRKKMEYFKEQIHILNKKLRLLK